MRSPRVVGLGLGGGIDCVQGCLRTVGFKDLLSRKLSNIVMEE